MGIPSASEPRNPKRTTRFGTAVFLPAEGPAVTFAGSSCPQHTSAFPSLWSILVANTGAKRHSCTRTAGLAHPEHHKALQPDPMQSQPTRYHIEGFGPKTQLCREAELLLLLNL